MTTKREEWVARQDGPWVTSHGGAGPIIAVVYGNDDVTIAERARRIAAVPDMEAELLEVRHLLSLMADGDPEWHRGGKVQKRLEGVTAALRKARRIP